MFPHSNLQTIIGVGVPTASQMIEILPPISTFMLGGGAMLIDGAAVFKTVHEHTWIVLIHLINLTDLTEIKININMYKYFCKIYINFKYWCIIKI